MDFDFSPEEQKFADEVEQWLVDNHDPVVMDPHARELHASSRTPPSGAPS